MDGGILDQPANFGELVHFAQHEIECFYNLVAERKAQASNK